ncbi:protein GLUTAMINE DUMPER 4 [Vigna angularis]|nr:protein GLUTAMINE DUMPER 4 [Vigna angularis]
MISMKHLPKHKRESSIMPKGYFCKSKFIISAINFRATTTLHFTAIHREREKSNIERKMRPINTVSSSSPPPPGSVTGIKIWKSPIPYLFGGLALMLALISVSLVILVCSYRKRDSSPESSSSSSEAENMKSQPMTKILYTNSEPEVVVIMAGDHNPTYLAKPSTTSSSASSSVYCTCGAQSQPEPESQPSPSSTSSTE